MPSVVTSPVSPVSVTNQVFEFYGFPIVGKPTLIKESRNTLPDLFNALGYKRGAEIGVERGVYSEIIADKMPGVELCSIDSWRAYDGYREHVTQEKLHEIYVDAVRRLKGKSKILVNFSMDAVNDFYDETLDFVYIDSNHGFLHVAQDIHFWSQKVKRGGIVAGHDFKRHKGNYTNHVKDVVQAWTYSHGINPWFVLNGDKSPSWFWVKE